MRKKGYIKSRFKRKKEPTSVLSLLLLSKMEHKKLDLPSHLNQKKKEKTNKQKTVFKTLDIKQPRPVISEMGTEAEAKDSLSREDEIGVLGTKAAKVLRAESWEERAAHNACGRGRREQATQRIRGAVPGGHAGLRTVPIPTSQTGEPHNPWGSG